MLTTTLNPSLIRSLSFKQSAVRPGMAACAVGLGLARGYVRASPLDPGSSDVLYTINAQTQGHVTDPNNAHKQDTQSQAYRAGLEARRNSDSPIDAASLMPKLKAHGQAKGNKEGIGMVDQVGSATGFAARYEEDSAETKKAKANAPEKYYVEEDEAKRLQNV